MKRCIVLLSMAIAQFAFGQTSEVRESWSGIGVAMNNYGQLWGSNPCDPSGSSTSIEFPLGSGVDFSWSGVWIGAKLSVNGGFERRVTTAIDFSTSSEFTTLESELDCSPNIGVGIHLV
jgi:hypothetical protein